MAGVRGTSDRQTLAFISIDEKCAKEHLLSYFKTLEAKLI